MSSRRPSPASRSAGANRRHHEGYARRVAVAAAIAAAVVVVGLAWGPSPTIRPYALDPGEDASPHATALRFLPTRIVTYATDDAVQPVADDVDVWQLPPLRSLPHEVALAPRRLAPLAHRYDFALPSTNPSTVLFRMTPIYEAEPTLAPRAGLVVVKVRVGRNGRVVEARVVRGVRPELDQQALVAAWQVRLPRERLAAAASPWITLPYEFERPPAGG